MIRTIRGKLLVLLGTVALLPAVLTVTLDAHVLRALSRDLTTRSAAVLAEQALSTMNRIAAEYAAALDRESRRVRLLLALQASEAERLLAAPDAAPAVPVHFDESFERGEPALELTVENGPRVARERRDGEPLAVSWKHVALHASPGLERDVTATARALAAMGGFFQRVRDPTDNLLGWHYVVLESGLSASYPGHGGNPPGFDPRARPWYALQRARPGFHWYRPHFDASTGALLINATLPLRNARGEFVGVTGIDVDLRSTFELLELPPHLRAGSELLQVAVVQPPAVERAAVRVVARQHAARDGGDWQTLPELAPLDLGDDAATAAVTAAMLAGENGHLRAATAQGESFVLYRHYGDAMAYVVTIVPVASAAAAATDAARHAAAATGDHLRSLIALVAAVTVLAGLVAIAAAHHVAGPIAELTGAVGRLAGGDFTARARIATHDELRTLGDAFNAMVPQLKAHARVEEALMLAREVQQKLLPPASPTLPGFEICGITRYSEHTGGDYFDYLDIDTPGGSRTAVVVADVSGHGIGPALLMATTRALLHGARDRGHTPGELLAYLNRELADDVSRGHFVTLFLLALDPRHGALEWAGAGHDAALVWDASANTVVELGSDDIPLGIDATWSFATANGFALAPGDVVLLGTDGVWETANVAGARFGKDRVREHLAARAAASAGVLCSELEDALAAFRGEAAQHDDLTLVVIKRNA